MVLILLLIFNSSTQAVGDRSKRTNYRWYCLVPHLLQFFFFFFSFSSLEGSKYFFLFAFFDFSLSILPERKPHKTEYSSLINPTSGLLIRIRWSISISKSWRIFLLILFSRVDSWFMHIPFVSMVKFQSLAQFPVDPLSNAVTPGFIILLCILFAASAYSEISRFNFFITIYT